MSTVDPSHLNDRIYDHVIIGAGIGGLFAAYELRSKLAKGSVLVIDGGQIFGEQSLSSISGGEISVGLGVGSRWGRAGVGEEIWDEFLRHTMVAAQDILGMADGFERTTTHRVRTSSGLITAIADEATEAFVREEEQILMRLVQHDLRYRPGPSNGMLSVSALKEQFGLVAEIPGREILGGFRYRAGVLNRGEGAVNPAMLGVALRYLARGEINIKGELVDPDPQVRVDFAEFIHADKITMDGVVECSARNGEKVRFQGRNVILAGAPAHIVEGINLGGAHAHLKTKPFRSIIAITEPVSHLSAQFRTAVHDTTNQYNYTWLDPASERVMWGTGDFRIYPGMPKEEMAAFARHEMQETFQTKHVPRIDYVWAGDIPYTYDGFPYLFRQGAVSGFGAPGGNGLVASAALGRIAVRASLGDEHAQVLVAGLMKRQPGFDAAALARQTPDYQKPPHFLAGQDFEPYAVPA